MIIFARKAMLEQGWADGVRITVRDGRIDDIQTGRAAAPGDIRADLLAPAMANLHSHAFQRAMAGMTEYRAAGRDSFWTWRELMYRFLDRLTPDHIQAITALAYLEMLEAGFASVAEFHYLHHGQGGTPYADLTELSQRIFAAAELTGIGLTHLPVLYSYGGVDGRALQGGQLRFANDLDRFLRLADDSRALTADLPADTGFGVAPHSLRATSPADLQALLAANPTGPVHIHAAEQLQEVRDVEAGLGARPVAWLLQNAGIDRRWCLIHSTHMTQDETQSLARSGAVAGLCPITEANLGDGIFNGPTYLESGGHFGIGTDSNIRISPVEELRQMEYSQRLRDMARNVLVIGEGSTGEQLYRAAAAGGAQALQRDCGAIRQGAWADLVAWDGDHPALCGLSDLQLVDGACFAASDRIVTDLWSAGRHLVKQGRHVRRQQITDDYRAALRDLMDRL